MPTSVRRSYFFAFCALTLSAGCERREPSAPPSPSAWASPPPAPLVLYTWADYVPQDVLERFTRATGLPVRYRSYENTDEMTSELASRPELYDIIITDGYSVNRLVRNQFVTPLRRRLLPNFENIAPEYRGLAFDRENQFSVPYLWGATVIAFDSKRVVNDSKTWSFLWNAEALGNLPVYLVDEPIDLFSVALLEQGDSINTSDPGQLAEAAARLQEQFDLINVRHVDVTRIRNALESGECAAAMIYSGDALMARKTNPDIELMIPENGVPLWIDHFLISRESRHVEQAHALIDFLLEGRNAADCANYACCPSPNLAASPYVDEALNAGGEGVPSAEVLGRSEYLDSGGTSKLRQIALLMRAVKHRDRLIAAPDSPRHP